MSRRRPGGFTLIELMTVILIVGLLLALLLPALGAMRETGRRTQCQHKLRQLAAAVQLFESKQTHYPGWRYAFRIKDDTIPQEVTWPLLVSPYTERRDVYERFQQNGPARENVVSLRELLVCPSDSEKMNGPPAATSYLGNTGRVDNFELAEDNGLPPDARANGVFMDINLHGAGEHLML
jgi:prepilin-type N-terminal cleavage/methylation domain-containing protein